MGASGVLDDRGKDVCYGTTVMYNNVNAADLRTKKEQLVGKSISYYYVKKQSMYLFDDGVVRRYISSS